MAKLKEFLVADASALIECCEHLRARRRFGLDTEFIGEKSYHPELCLAQVATTDALYLIDPFALESLEPFWQVVVDPANQVIVHAGREEVRLCHLWSGQTPGNLFDLQIAAGLVGLTYPIGHGSLVAHIVGKKLEKGETLTQWSNRPLTKAQVRYAFDDVRYLLPIWQELSARLEKLGRAAWAEEEFARLQKQATPDDEGMTVSADKWRKIKGVSSLERRRLAILRELFFWRERMAVELNRPARTIVRDDLLMEITRRNPRSVKDLIPVRGLAKTHLERIIAAVERGRMVPLDDCPTAAERDDDPPQVGLAVNLLATQLAYLAQHNQVAGNLIATTSDLKMVVRSRMRQTELAVSSLLTQGWRREHFWPHMEAMLDGRVALRMGDLGKDVPVELQQTNF